MLDGRGDRCGPGHQLENLASRGRRIQQGDDHCGDIRPRDGSQPQTGSQGHLPGARLDRPDPVLSELGAKGLGEIGTVASAAAVGNAVFNATGRRVRDLPITLDKLLQHD
ncbi:hypothetical protein ACQEVI_26170 [Promicromonospora sp. CA-289599]|uniref:hypothetical protein n=1 Tax=Promicromonospora sp. CA-289599 TaxID=3240014 RepID=UPI003D9451ED